MKTKLRSKKATHKQVRRERNYRKLARNVSHFGKSLIPNGVVSA